VQVSVLKLHEVSNPRRYLLRKFALKQVVDARPEQSLRYLHRFNKHFAPDYATRKGAAFLHITAAEPQIWSY
jgi:hypothetical protein